MAQVKFGNCLSATTVRPDLTPPDLGYYTVEKKSVCLDNLPRRSDVVREAPKGDPTVAFLGAMDNGAGIASLDPRPMEYLSTEQGRIGIGKGAVQDVSWLPTVADLQMAPYTDTRRTAISDRYFR